jgi:hypothetical protein
VLDYPPLAWEEISRLLVEDLERLCWRGGLLPQERLVALRWRICGEGVIGDAQEVGWLERELLVGFRYPYALAAEAPHYATALTQFERHFTAASTALPQRLVSWEVELAERWRPVAQEREIFAQITAPQIERLQQLENRLKVDLELYLPQCAWVPEAAFSAVQAHDYCRSYAALNRANVGALQALGRQRPSYIYAQPLPLQDSSLYERMQKEGGWSFLERISLDWSAADEAAMVRDYHQVTLADGVSLWVYCDQLQRWYLHGIFA